MLLLHGGPGGTDYLFKFFAKPLANAGWKAVSFIQRGSMGSPSEGPFVIQAFAEDVEAVRLHLGAERVGVLGHSWGGLLAAIYASQHPEYIERLILVSPIGARTGWRAEFNAEIRRRLAPDVREEYDHLKVQAQMAHSREDAAQYLLRRANIAVTGYFSEKHRAGKPGLAFLEPHLHKSIIEQLEGWYAEPSWEEGLRRLKCPATVIWGEEDPIPGWVPDGYRELLPNLEVHRIPECGHFPWMEEDEAFYAVLDRALKLGGA
ncbi:MAG: proline iminopeptidase [Candidatus Sumerlaeota bacterium]|nr:proline iminopeptidase [Candidatus Sumerlaeota bacterium]